MKPIEIITIVACVAIVLGVIIASIVRKVKGKPSLGCDCAGCAHAKECNGNCACSGNIDINELIAKRKQELAEQNGECTCESGNSSEQTCECCCHCDSQAENKE